MSKPLPSAYAGPHPRTALLNTLFKVAGTGLSFLLFLVMARTMTPEDFASVALAMAWLALASVLTSLSMPAVLVRFLPEYLANGRPDAARGAVLFAIGLSVATSALLALLSCSLLLGGWSGLDAAQYSVAVLGCLLLVPSTLLLVMAGVLQGFKRVLAAELMINTLRPVLMLSGLAALWWHRNTLLPASTVLTVYLFATLLILLLSTLYAAGVAPAAMRHERAYFSRREWLASALGFMGVMIAAAINERVDLLVMGFSGDAADLAVYAVAARFVQPVIIAATAASAVMIPHLVERLPLLKSGGAASVQPMIRRTARTILGVSVVAWFALWLLAPWFLKLFGPHYLPALTPLLILVGGQVGAALFGPASAVAAFAGQPRLALLSLSAGIVVNVTLNLLLVPRLGATGAALATASATILAAALAWAWLRHSLRVNAGVI